jgi:hypothetical protein
MTRRIVSIIALTSLWALGAQAQPGPAGQGPGQGPGSHAHAPGGPAGKPGGPGANPGAPDPAGKGRPNLGELKDRMEKGGPPTMQERAAKLKERAAQLRKDGRDKQAEALEKQAERLASAKPGEPGAATNPANKAKVRQARKLARVKLLQRRYGEFLKDNAVRQEVETHARRSANLSRMKSLAGARPDADDKQKDAKQKLVERINRLMARENARHSRTMAKLTKQQDKLANKTLPSEMPPASKAPAKDTKEEAEK